MFILHTSNKAEYLLQHMATVLQSPLSSAFSIEHFLIQSQGMERWVCQQMAESRAVWSNYEFHFPGKFYNVLIDQLMHDEEKLKPSYTQEQMLWRFEAILRKLPEHEGNLLQQYLQGPQLDIKRFQLAKQLAYTFDQYQFLRPDWMTQWAFTDCHKLDIDTAWQCQLWQALQAEGKGVRWRVAIEKLQTLSSDKAREYLPERLSVFGISAMSPIYLELMQAIARHIDVHFYLLSPAAGFWGDIKTKRQWQTQPLQTAQQQDLFAQSISSTAVAEGSPLLSMLGQQGRDFQQLLADDSITFDLDFTSFDEAESHVQNLLQHLQQDLVETDFSVYVQGADSSIQLHACHSRMREVEVLRDQIQAAFDADSALELRDVVVMAPDVHQYAPFIAAVFHDIPHSIADSMSQQSNQLLDTFIQFLSVTQSRWAWDDIVAILEQAVVYENLGLSSTQLDVVKHWIQRTNIRWGASAEHRAENGLPAISTTSWQSGLERLLMGYMLDEEAFHEGILPYIDIEGSTAQALGGLRDFIVLLNIYKQRFRKSYDLQGWSQLLSEAAHRLFKTDDNYRDAFKQLQEYLEELEKAQAMNSQLLSLEVVLLWLRDYAQQQQSSAGFMRGRLTFCSMLPMRAIPFKVIALIGMNEGEFPRQDVPADFDLMAKQEKRIGDRSLRDDDRYQFLEVLLSVRQQLLLSYVGFSNKTNDPIQPSIVISELLEVLEKHYQINAADISYQHPLHGHSTQYFNAEKLFSYSDRHFQTANALQKTNGPSPSWHQPVAQNDEELDVIPLDDLLAFIGHPQQYFAESVLGLRIPRIDDLQGVSEHFDLEGLNLYLQQQQWIEELLENDCFEESLKAIATGDFPLGTSGQLRIADHQREVSEFVEKLREPALGIKVDNQSVDVKVNGKRLVGQLHHQYRGGQLFYRYAKMKGKDLLIAWVSHLLALQTRQQSTFLFAKDRVIEFKAMSGDEALTLLSVIIEAFLQGRQQLSHFWVGAGMAWYEQAFKTRSAVAPIIVAEKAFELSWSREPYWQLFYDDANDFTKFSTTFESICEDILGPIIHSQQT